MGCLSWNTFEHRFAYQCRPETKQLQLHPEDETVKIQKCL